MHWHIAFGSQSAHCSGLPQARLCQPTRSSPVLPAKRPGRASTRLPAHILTRSQALRTVGNVTLLLTKLSAFDITLPRVDAGLGDERCARRWRSLHFRMLMSSKARLHYWKRHWLLLTERTAIFAELWWHLPSTCFLKSNWPTEAVLQLALVTDLAFVLSPTANHPISACTVPLIGVTVSEPQCGQAGSPFQRRAPMWAAALASV